MPLMTPEGALKLVVYIGIRRDGRLLLVEYESAPNPDKSGWWIPAPEVAYGEDPLERAIEEAASLGYSKADMKLMDVESFTMGGANWHVLIHYILDVQDDPKPGPNIAKWQWMDTLALPEPSEFAHGKWEAELALAMLDFK